MRPPFTLIALLAISLSACTHAPDTRPILPSASHVGVDQAVAAAHASQKHAETQVSSIEKKITDPVFKQDIMDLHSTITDLGFKLDDATAKIQWYEGQYKLLYDDNAKAHVDLDKETAIAIQKTKEAHDNACQRDLFLYTFSAIFALWCLKKAGQLIPDNAGLFALFARIAAFVGGFLVAYGFFRGIVAIAARVIP